MMIAKEHYYHVKVWPWLNLTRKKDLTQIFWKWFKYDVLCSVANTHREKKLGKRPQDNVLSWRAVFLRRETVTCSSQAGKPDRRAKSRPPKPGHQHGLLHQLLPVLPDDHRVDQHKHAFDVIGKRGGQTQIWRTTSSGTVWKFCRSDSVIIFLICKESDF